MPTRYRACRPPACGTPSVAQACPENALLPLAYDDVAPGLRTGPRAGRPLDGRLGQKEKDRPKWQI